MVKESMLFIAGAMCTIIPYHTWHTVHPRQFRIVPEVVLLELLFTLGCTIDTTELTHIYRYALVYEVITDLYEYLLQISLIVTRELICRVCSMTPLRLVCRKSILIRIIAVYSHNKTVFR